MNDSQVVKNDPETNNRDIAVKISNASFSWGVEIESKPENAKDKKKKKKNKVNPIEENKDKNKKTKKNLLIQGEDNKDMIINDSSQFNANKDDMNTLLTINQNENSELKKILKNINFEVKKGEFVAIIGEVGSGKSSLLQAILNNMILIDEKNQLDNNEENEDNSTDKQPNVIINGEISYVSQISWIENDTLKNNILFNQPLDEEKYKNALTISELNPDLEMLVGGDMTEIGEKGINLSGGQKARVSIARAIYSEKDIYIFDDPISALDAHVGERIMKNCILDYLKNKTRILVTHALQYLKFVDRIILIKEGKIIWEGNYDNLIKEEFYADMSLKIATSNENEDEDEDEEDEKEGYDDHKSIRSSKKMKTVIEDSIEENLDYVIKSRATSMIINKNRADNNNENDSDDQNYLVNEDFKNEEESEQDLIKDVIKENEGIPLIETKMRSVTKRTTVAKSRKVTKKKTQSDMIIKPKEIKRIIAEEDKEVGSVKFSVYLSYIKMLGGYFMFSLVLIIILVWQGSRLFSDLFLTYWTKNQEKENNFEYFSIYGAISFSGCFLVTLRMCILLSGSLKTSRFLHKEMLLKLVRAPINLFHDTIPKGQILNRISKDLTTIDSYTVYIFTNVVVYLFSFFGAIAICSIMNIYCLIFMPFILLVGLLISRFYMCCSRDLSRLDGIIRSPIINLLSATIPGAITIRAFKYEDKYINKFYERVDNYYKVRLFVSGAQNWFGMSIDILSITFLSFIIIFIVIFKDQFTSQNTGLMLTYYVVLQDTIFAFLSFTTALENAMVSLERCLKYLEIPQEKPNLLESDESLISWPSEGKIEFKDFSVKYRPDNELILKNLNFVIKPNEKVGVVGRTGSGKSTLCLCLFRILEPLIGTIVIDNVDITHIGLKKLRNSITIIPQVLNKFY